MVVYGYMCALRRSLRIGTLATSIYFPIALFSLYSLSLPHLSASISFYPLVLSVLTYPRTLFRFAHSRHLGSIVIIIFYYINNLAMYICFQTDIFLFLSC